MPAKGWLKSVKAYEAEAVRVGNCLVHSAKSAPRKVWQRRHGRTLLRHLYVCHTCDVRGCILDAHHFIGTAKDNSQDMVAKGRHVGTRGHACHTTPHAEASKKKMAKSHRRTWRKPGYAEHQAEVRRSPEFKAKLAKPRPSQSTAMHRLWADEAFRQKVHEAKMSPKGRKRASTAATDRWQNQVYRDSVMKTRMSPEGRAKASTAAVERERRKRLERE